jgi:hypothetical protein
MNEELTSVSITFDTKEMIKELQSFLKNEFGTKVSVDFIIKKLVEKSLEGYRKGNTNENI